MKLRLILLPLGLLLPACPDNTGTTDSNSASSGATTTDGTVGMSSTPTTSGDVTGTAAGTEPDTATTTGPGTATTPATATATATTDDPTRDPTTGGDEIAGLCGSLCMRNDECMLGIDPADCVQGCTGDLNQGEGECRDATILYLGCLIDMTCAQLKALFDDDDPGPCEPQVEQLAVACSDTACRTGVSGGGEGSECEVSVMCPDEPLLEMKCDAELCHCFSAGEPTGECPAEGVCINLDALPNMAESCCGF